MHQNGVRKRSRKIWSCLQCRKKKLQCDHGRPACGRCTRAGQTEKCIYTSDEGSSAKAARDEHDVPSQGALSRTPGSNSSIAHMRESYVANTSRASPIPRPTAPSEPWNQAYPSTSSDRILLRGSGFRTKFNGSTNDMVLVERITGLASFTSDALATYPAFEQIQQHLNGSEARNIHSGPASVSEQDLRALLPPREEADRLVRLYLSSFDKIYPILPTPLSDGDVGLAWLLPADADGHTTVIALLVIAVALCLTPMSFNDVSSGRKAPRDQATLIIDTCQTWQHARIVKYDSMADFQIAHLLLLSQQINRRRNKRTWAHAGHVVRSFMCFGLHRDPANLDEDTTSSDRLMRRRIWLSSADFELQAAFEHGMQAVSWPQQSDLDPSTCELDDPPHQPDSEAERDFTRPSYLHLSGQSMLLRHELNDLLNNVHTSMSFQTAVDYTTKLKTYLSTIPDWPHPDSKPISALLRINLHQYILATHDHQLRTTQSPVEQQFSRVVLLESAMEMLDHHKTALDAGGFLVELFYQDHIRAALSICHVYMTADPKSDRLLVSSILRDGLQYMELALSLLTEKALRFGGIASSLWLTSAAIGLMKSSAEPGKRPALIEEAVERFTRPFHRLMALQRAPMTLAGGERRAEKLANAGDPGDVANPGLAMPFPEVTLPIDYANIGAFDGLAEWAFDDWLLDDMEFTLN